MFTRQLDNNSESLGPSTASTAAQLHFSRGWPANYWFIETLLFLMALFGAIGFPLFHIFSPRGKTENDHNTQCATTLATHLY